MPRSRTLTSFPSCLDRCRIDTMHLTLATTASQIHSSNVPDYLPSEHNVLLAPQPRTRSNEPSRSPHTRVTLTTHRHSCTSNDDASFSGFRVERSRIYPRTEGNETISDPSKYSEIPNSGSVDSDHASGFIYVHSCSNSEHNVASFQFLLHVRYDTDLGPQRSSTFATQPRHLHSKITGSGKKSRPICRFHPQR